MGLFENRKSVFGGILSTENVFDGSDYGKYSEEENESEFADLENLYKFDI